MNVDYFKLKNNTNWMFACEKYNKWLKKQPISKKSSEKCEIL